VFSFDPLATAEIDIALEGTQFMIKVRDFGKGIPAQALSQSRDLSVGVGIRGMRERVRPYGGDVRIDSQEQHGTLMTITLSKILAT
jgi:signal transduction histidine kinase